MSTPISPHGNWLRIEAKQRELDLLAKYLLARPAGVPVSLPAPDPSEGQLAFFGSTLWLHAWFKEAWSASYYWLSRYGTQLGVTAPTGNFVPVLGRIRTFLVHNLDAAHPPDERTRRQCQEWFHQACGSSMPSQPSEWWQCLNRLLEQGLDHTSYAFDVAKAVERSPDRATYVQLWRQAVERRDVAAHLGVLQEVAGDLGLAAFDAGRIKAVHRTFQDRWNDEIAALSADADAGNAQRCQADRALLADTVVVLPFSSQEVMANLALRPGLEVLKALRLAHALNELWPDASRQELLDLLKEQWTFLTDKPLGRRRDEALERLPGRDVCE